MTKGNKGNKTLNFVHLPQGKNVMVSIIVVVYITNKDNKDH